MLGIAILIGIIAEEIKGMKERTMLPLAAINSTRPGRFALVRSVILMAAFVAQAIVIEQYKSTMISVA